MYLINYHRYSTHNINNETDHAHVLITISQLFTMNLLDPIALDTHFDHLIGTLVLALGVGGLPFGLGFRRWSTSAAIKNKGAPPTIRRRPKTRARASQR